MVFFETHVRALIWALSFLRFFSDWIFGVVPPLYRLKFLSASIQAEVSFSLYRGGSPTHFSQPAQPGGGPLRASVLRL